MKKQMESCMALQNNMEFVMLAYSGKTIEWKI